MRMILPLLLVSAVASADPSTIKLTYVAKDNPKAVAAMKEEMARHMAALDKATNGKKFEITVTLTKLEKTADATKCGLSISVGAPGNSLYGNLNGGASVNGITEAAAADCIGGSLGDMVDKKIVKLIEDKAK